MDWKQILSLSNEDLNDERVEEIYLELVKDQKFDGKIVKKLFPLCLTVLKHKGYQVEKQREEIELLISSDIDLRSTLEEMEKQKRMISTFETERSQYKTRIKELSDEMSMIQGRELQGSDEDSPDQLSEIDRQQELMANISMKNKHIKRLLRDIEKLEEQTLTHVHIIKETKATVDDAANKIKMLESQLAEALSSSGYLEDQISKLNDQLQEQEAENQQLIQERKHREKELEMFSSQLEERIIMYKTITDDKQRELDAANEKLSNVLDQLPAIDIDNEQSEIKRLMESMKEKDNLIQDFEAKIQILSAELVDSTNIITKLGNERDEHLKRLTSERNDKCCEQVEAMLETSKVRCQELQEMLELADEDNVLKAKQTFEAIEALKSYENSEDGLADTVRKLNKLQESVHLRDKQIHELVIELNSQNEIVAENGVLRKRFGIPDDEIIETKAFLAKQKKCAKINDRLMLKLRASEEMRLQLKLDKNDLKRRIAQLVGKQTPASDSSQSLLEPEPVRKQSTPVEIKQCENCLDTYNMFDSVKFCKSCIMKQNSNLCDNCVNKFKVSSSENIELIKKIAKLEIDHQAVTEENENLRVGLNEILEKLRDFEGSSERTIINAATLEKLIYILNLRNASSISRPVPNLQEYQRTSEMTNKAQTEADLELLHLKTLVKDLSEKNDSNSVDLEKMRVLEENYDELVRSSELCDDEKDRLIIKSIERCHKFEADLKAYERKIDFLKSQNDHFSGELKSLKLSSMTLITDLRMEILEKSKQISETVDKSCNGSSDDDSDVNELRLELEQIRTQFNSFCSEVFKNIKVIDNENVLKLNQDQLANITVLENNLSTSFITRAEINSMKSRLKRLQDAIKAHDDKEKHLEELSKITQSQLKSQQLMLSQLSDEEISARHLIVDLQSLSNDNYLLAKTTRELTATREREDELRLQIDQLKTELDRLNHKLAEKNAADDDKYSELKERESNNSLKIEYLKKTLKDLCNKYSSMAPVYLVADFVKDYETLLKTKQLVELNLMKQNSRVASEVSLELIISELKETNVSKSDIEAKIEMIKHKSSCDFLKQQLINQEQTVKKLQEELAQAKINEVKNNQHWNAIKMLFNETANGEVGDDKSGKKLVNKQSQTVIQKADCATNTETVQATPSTIVAQPTQSKTLLVSAPSPPPAVDIDQKSLESQLKKALMIATSRSALLIETENRLAETQGRMKGLEKSLESRDSQKEREKETTKMEAVLKKDDHVLSITISTLQNLLLEKDTTLSRYQELLKSERQHQSRAYDEISDEVKQLKRTLNSQEASLAERLKEIERLKSEIIELERKSRVQSRVPSPDVSQAERHVTFNEHEIEKRNIELKLKDSQNELKKMEQQLKDLINTERQHQNIIRDKDGAIRELNGKLKASKDELNSLKENFGSTTEIDQLRDMLEEKDKHIQDLTVTLNQFHDDQQKYINDSAMNSAEQVHLISSDLNRADATNRVLKTQLEALKRQVTNIQAREKQAREMIKTLKNQLIRRPVISVKSDKRPSTAREEQLQKRVHDLENELIEVKDDLRRQTNINDNKKAKNAAELGLWDKQKRYQELSEKLKAKLTEKEIDCERMKANFQIAKNNITRLERERTMLENKLKNGRYLSNINISQQSGCVHCHPLKYPIEETPTVASSDVTSDTSHDLISALKSRIESQQRRIISLELDGKGSNAVATEMDNLQEHLSTIESQNIRLEAKNIQLQLDYDLIKQNESGHRQEARIKHLEDYILVLKDELAQSHSKLGVLMTGKPVKHHDHHQTSQNQAMEQTILTLKRVIEKLKVENKYLKEPKSCSSSVPSTSSYISQTDRKKEEIFERLKNEHEKLQRSHNETLGKISALEIELQLSQTHQAITVSCPHCNRIASSEMATQDADVLSQQLQQKTIILEKAKTLLTRAAAKEKHLREQIFHLKKRVCDLEGVPVISEENSESGC